jgi:hypothetical protein
MLDPKKEYILQNNNNKKKMEYSIHFFFLRTTNKTKQKQKKMETKKKNRLNVFALEQSRLIFRNKEGIPVFSTRYFRNQEYYKLYYLSNGESVVIHRNNLIHFDTNQVLKHSLKIIRYSNEHQEANDENFYSTVCAKLRDDTIVFLDRTSAPDRLVNFWSNINIYDTKTMNLSLQIETNFFAMRNKDPKKPITIQHLGGKDRFVLEDAVLLELQNGNILAYDGAFTIHSWDRNGKFLFSLPFKDNNCKQDAKVVKTTTPFCMKEIEENKILYVCDRYHYHILDLETLQISAHDIKIDTRESYDEETMTPCSTCEIIILTKELLWIKLCYEYSILYNIKNHRIAEEIYYDHPRQYITIPSNFVFCFRRDEDPYFMDSRMNIISAKNIMDGIKSILYTDENSMIVLDYKYRIVLHKIYQRFVVKNNFFKKRRPDTLLFKKNSATQIWCTNAAILSPNLLPKIFSRVWK